MSYDGVSHTHRKLPNGSTREDWLNLYRTCIKLECIPDNRGGGNDDSRFDTSGSTAAAVEPARHGRVMFE
jgi:hypothetical protein